MIKDNFDNTKINVILNFKIIIKKEQLKINT